MSRQPSNPFAPKRHRYALEPRQMYDGAGAVEAHHAAAHADAAHEASEASRAPTTEAAMPAPRTEAPPPSARSDSSRDTASQNVTQVYVVDKNVTDYQSLVAQLPKGSEVILIDDSRSGVDQIAEALAGRHDVTALHILSHGANDSITLGTDTVTADNLGSHSAEWAAIGASMAPGGDILLYGCDVASKDSALVTGIAGLTHADVAASSNDTGAARLGGDWTLEVKTGVIEARTLNLDYDGLLAAPTVDTTTKTLTVAEPSVLNAAGAERGTLSGWTLTDVSGNGSVTVSAVVRDTSVGTLSTTTTAGVVGITGGYRFTGSVADASAWLNQLVFTAADKELGKTAASTDIDVTVTDSASLTATHSLDVMVTPSNDPVTVADATTSVVENSTVTIGSSVLVPVDPELAIGAQTSAQIIYTVTASPQYGYLTANGSRLGIGSTFSQADVDAGNITYVHTATGASQNTMDGFDVSVNDGATPTSQSDTAHVTINIDPVNQAPGISGGGTVYEGQPANAVDTGDVGKYIVATSGGDPQDTDLTITITSLPQNGGTLYLNGVAVTAGQTFLYSQRDQLTYAHDGREGVATDSFGVSVTDMGGGTNQPATTTGTITLDVRAVDDNPVFVSTSSRDATVPADGTYIVTLTPAMITATDVDTANANISFVTAQSGLLTHGYLLLNGYRLPDGASFSMADVNNGLVKYVQTSGATAGQTDTFNFRVIDNTTGLRWNPDGTTYNQAGGVYDASNNLQVFTFTLHLADTPDGDNGTFPILSQPSTTQTSGYGGVEPTSGSAHGDLLEGSSIVIQGTTTNGVATDYNSGPALSFTATDVPSSRVIYTFLGFQSDGAGSGTAGVLQEKVNGNWVTIQPYGTFTQADLDAGLIRFQHDGDSEDFSTKAMFSVSAGLSTVVNGQSQPDTWTPTLTFYVTPQNDAPVATGSSDNTITEGSTLYITSAQLHITDPDDATSEDYLENSPTLVHGDPNYAYNNDATGQNALKFLVSQLPTGGTLQYSTDGGHTWQNVTANTQLDASIITGSAGTTGLRFVSNGSEVRSTVFQVEAVDRWGQASTSNATVAIAMTNVNDAPQLATDPTQADPTVPSDSPNQAGGDPANNPAVVDEGGKVQITSQMLQAYDPDNTATQVQYTVTGVPAHGMLAYSTNGVTFSQLGSGSSFSQNDIAQGYIWYLNNGDESTSGGNTSGAPDDRITFRLADGNKQQAAADFWIYVRPENDPPKVTAPTGPVAIDSSNPANNLVSGFVVADPDLTTVSAGESDYLQVTVRLLNNDGSAFNAAAYAGVTLGVAAGSGVTIDTDKDGAADYLVMSGTRAEINQALAGLSVTFSTDRNALYQVQVIADDRLRDGNGALSGGANGGTLNQSTTPGTGTDGTAVDATNYDWYSASVPANSGNLAASAVVIRASLTNDPGVLTGPTAITVKEDQPTFIGGSFVVSDPESAAFDTPVRITLTVGSGSLGIGGTGTQTSVTPPGTGMQAVTISGDNSGSLVLIGRASDIQALLNDTTLGLTYVTAANVNHDTNGAADGDVTLRVQFDDAAGQTGGDPGSRIGDDNGSGSTANNPADLNIAVTIDAMNDAPTVNAGTGSVTLVGTTAVPGFSVSDVDTDTAVGPGETDFMQVTVRIDTAAGVPLGAADYVGITLASKATDSGVTVDTTYGGQDAALVIRGTRDQVNAYLAGLTVAIGGPHANDDVTYRVEVIADDRLRDLSTGQLDGSGLANGGPDPAANGNGTMSLPTADVAPYAAIPGGLTNNVGTASRDVFPTAINDPAHVDVTPVAKAEGAGAIALPAINVTDSDATATGTLTVTVTLPAGFTFSAVGGSGGTITANTGVSHSTLTLTGTLTEIDSRLANLSVSLPDVPGTPGAADWNGSFDVTVVVNDNGNSGTRPTTLANDTDNPRSNPGDFSYADDTSAALITTRTFTVVVNPVNDAPTATVGSVTVGPVAEDTPAGSAPTYTVQGLFSAAFDDSRDAVNNSTNGANGNGSSADTFQGVAIASYTPNAAQGVWQYSVNGGTTWADVGARTTTNALYLGGDALLRFVPAANFFGTPATLAARLVETDTNGDATGTVPASGSTVSLSGANTPGGSSRYSVAAVTLNTSVTNVNDQPTINGDETFGLNEDVTLNVGSLASAFDYSDATDNQSGIAGGGHAEGTAALVAIIGNTTDASKGQFQYYNGASWVAVPTSGLSEANALVLAASTQVRFVPTPDYNGAVPGSLQFRVSDSSVAGETGASQGAGQNITAYLDDSADSTSHWSKATTLSVSYNPVQDANNDTASTHAGVAKDVNVLQNDSFSNPDRTVTAVTNGQHGQVTINPDNTVHYAPVAGYVGTDTFTYTVTSGGVTETATVTMTMTNTVPVAANDTRIVPEDSLATGNVLTNDTDADPTDTLHVTTFTVDSVVYSAGQTATLAHGSLQVNANGTYTFTPVADWNGTVPVVTYEVSDGNMGGTANGTLAITVTPVADAVNDATSTHAGVPITIAVLQNDTFANSDRTVTAVTNGAHGSVVINPGGTVTYTPVAGYVGSDAFTYTVTSGGVTETATVNVTLTNSVPVASNDSKTVDEDTVASGNVLTNDTDADIPGTPDALRVTTFTVGGQTYNAGQTAVLTTGSLRLNGDGSYTFTPVADWNGTVPTVTYTVSDGNVGGTAQADLVITVTPVADIVSDAASTHAGVPVGLDVLSNDTFENTPVVTGVTQGQHGSVVINADGTGTYTPDAGYVGTDTFTYTVTSGGVTETANVTVTLTNTAPVAHDDANTVPEDATATGNVLANDTDADIPGTPDTLRVTTFTVDNHTYAAGQTATLAGGTLQLNADGSYTFTPVPDWNGTVPTVTYTVSDGNDGGTANANLVIVVTPVADIVNDAATTHAGTPVTVDVLANDGFANTPAVTGVTQGGHGGVTINPDGTVLYTPDKGYVGSDTFTYTVTSGGVTETATVTMTMTNTAPVALPDNGDVTEDGADLSVDAAHGVIASGSVPAGHDTDPDNDPLSVVGVIAGSSGTPASVIGHDVGQPVAGTYGSLTLRADGSYGYAVNNGDPRVNALKDGQSLTDTFSYAIADGNGGVASTTLTITIHGHTDGPASVGGSTMVVDESALVDHTPMANAVGSVDIVMPDGLASVALNGVSISAAQLADLGAHPVTVVTPAGTLVVTGFTTTSTVGGVPTAGTLSYTYTLDTAQHQPGQARTTDVIRLVVTDPSGMSLAGTLDAVIVNDVPVAHDDGASVLQDSGQVATTGNVFAGGNAGDHADRIGADGAATGGPVTAVSSANTGAAGHIGSVSAGQYGSLTLRADGSYAYALDVRNPAVASLDANRTLTEVFVYTITDADGDTSQAHLTITIGGLTPPIQAGDADRFFIPPDRFRVSTIPQPFEPGLFILPAIGDAQASIGGEAARWLGGGADIEDGFSAISHTLLQPEDAQHVLRDGVAFSRRVLAQLQADARISTSSFGRDESGLFRDFGPGAPRHAVPDERPTDRHEQQHEAHPRVHAPVPDIAPRHAAPIAVPGGARAQAGAPSLSQRLNLLAGSGVVPVTAPRPAATLPTVPVTGAQP